MISCFGFRNNNTPSRANNKDSPHALMVLCWGHLSLVGWRGYDLGGLSDSGTRSQNVTAGGHGSSGRETVLFEIEDCCMWSLVKQDSGPSNPK